MTILAIASGLDGHPGGGGKTRVSLDVHSPLASPGPPFPSLCEVAWRDIRVTAEGAASRSTQPSASGRSGAEPSGEATAGLLGSPASTPVGAPTALRAAPELEAVSVRVAHLTGHSPSGPCSVGSHRTHLPLFRSRTFFLVHVAFSA